MDATFSTALASAIEPRVLVAEQEEAEKLKPQQQRSHTEAATTPAPSDRREQHTLVQLPPQNAPADAASSEAISAEQPRTTVQVASTNAKAPLTPAAAAAAGSSTAAAVVAISREAPVEARTFSHAANAFNLMSWMQTGAALSESQVKSLSPEDLQQVLGKQTENIQALQMTVRQNDQLLEQQRKKQQMNAVFHAHERQQHFMHMQRVAPMQSMAPFTASYPIPFHPPQNVPMLFPSPMQPQHPVQSMPMMNQPWQQQPQLQQQPSGSMQPMTLFKAPTVVPSVTPPFATMPSPFLPQQNFTTCSIPISMTTTIPAGKHPLKASKDQAHASREKVLEKLQQERNAGMPQVDTDEVERKEECMVDKQRAEKMQCESTAVPTDSGVPPIDVSNAMAAGVAATAVSNESSPNRSPAHAKGSAFFTYPRCPPDLSEDPVRVVEDPTILRDYIRRVQEENQQLTLQYQLARNTIMTVHQYVHQETSNAVKEPPAVIFEMQSVLDEALARDIQLQQGTPSLDADPGTTLPRIPRLQFHPSTVAAASSLETDDPATSLTKMTSDEEKERRVRGKPRGRASDDSYSEAAKTQA